jgi:hypothetical protein
MNIFMEFFAKVRSSSSEPSNPRAVEEARTRFDKEA